MAANRQTVANWTDTNGPKTVQQYDMFGKGTGFISAESVILAAGKPDWNSTDNALNNFIPIGLVENANIQQNKALQQLFEIGSKRPFFIPGRHQIQAALSRVMFNGPSLMKALYYLVGESTGTTTVDATGLGGSEGIAPNDQPGFFTNPAESSVDTDVSANSDPL